MTLEIPQGFKHSTAKEEKYFNGKQFPLILEPEHQWSLKETLDAVKKNRETLDQLTVEYGAIAFRGFPLVTPQHFQDFLDCLGLDELPYVGGAAPRTVIVGNVVTTNEAPPEAKIPFHHEMAQVPLYPGRIFFYCDVPAPEGGQTPICPSNQVYSRLKEKHPEFISKLEELGVVYTRVLPSEDDPTSPIGRGWKSTFQTSDKEQAKIKAKDLGVTLEWLPNGDVKSVSGVLKGTKLYNSKDQFFNSIVAAYTGWKDSRNDPTKAVVYANGEQLDPLVIEDARVIMEDVCSNWKWQKGDVLMIDNHQTMHARKSFVPPRRILAALYNCKETKEEATDAPVEPLIVAVEPVQEQVPAPESAKAIVQDIQEPATIQSMEPRIETSTLDSIQQPQATKAKKNQKKKGSSRKH